MPAFGFVRTVRQQIKEHNIKQAAKDNEPDAKPYKHVPTHAAADAMSGVPSNWHNEYRPRIMEENRRRRAEAIAKRGSINLPLTANDTSNDSHLSASASLRTSLSKDASCSSFSSSWYERNSSKASTEDYFGIAECRKGKEREDVLPSPLSATVRPKAVLATNDLIQGTTRDYSTTEELKMLSRRTASKMSPYSTRESGSTSNRLRAAAKRGTDANHLNMVPQSKVSRQRAPAHHSSRSTQFAVPQPMDPMALGFDDSLPPPPPVAVTYSYLDQSSYSTDASRTTSSASSDRSEGSTLSSASTTPAASIIAYFPSTKTTQGMEKPITDDSAEADTVTSVKNPSPICVTSGGIASYPAGAVISHLDDLTNGKSSSEAHVIPPTDETTKSPATSEVVEIDEPENTWMSYLYNPRSLIMRS